MLEKHPVSLICSRLLLLFISDREYPMSSTRRRGTNRWSVASFGFSFTFFFLSFAQYEYDRDVRFRVYKDIYWHRCKWLAAWKSVSRGEP